MRNCCFFRLSSNKSAERSHLKIQTATLALVTIFTSVQLVFSFSFRTISHYLVIGTGWFSVLSLSIYLNESYFNVRSQFSPLWSICVSYGDKRLLVPVVVVLRNLLTHGGVIGPAAWAQSIRQCKGGAGARD